MPPARDAWVCRRVPVAELAALDASGLLAITVPRAHGGPELGAPVLAEVIRVIAAVDPAIAQVPQAHFLFTDVLAGSAVFADVPADPELVVPYAAAFTVPQQLGARTQLVHAAIQAGIAGGTLRDAGWFVRAAARGTLAVAPAKAFASEVAAEVTTEIFSLSGASAADERYGLSRHWRNARTHASHDPVSWKYHHVGNYLLNDVLPPNHGQL
jgi:alkylation response protein AidB-like acyl-CoA dehydrogenase